MRLCTNCPNEITDDEDFAWSDQANSRIYYRCKSCYKLCSYRFQEVRGTRWRKLQTWGRNGYLEERGVEFKGEIG